MLKYSLKSVTMSGSILSSQKSKAGKHSWASGGPRALRLEDRELDPVAFDQDGDPAGAFDVGADLDPVAARLGGRGDEHDRGDGERDREQETMDDLGALALLEEGW